MLANGTVDDRGLVLTKAEEAEWIARSKLRELVDPALAVIDALPDDFAGVYFDESTGRLVVHVNVSGADAATRAVVSAKVPLGVDVEWHDVRYSWRELDAARQAVLTAAPTGIRYMAISVTANRVEVAPQPDARDVVLAVAARNSSVTVIEHDEIQASACLTREACTIPWRGGTKTVNDGGFTCTWGFNGRPTSGSTTKFMIQAGHCSRLNKNVTHNNSVVNVAPGVDENTWDGIGTQLVDALSVPLKTDAGARNLIFINPQSTAYAITSTKSGASQRVGDLVCMSGAASGANGGVGFKCGKILDEGVTATYKREVDGKFQTMTALTTAAISHIGGDSGAPMISGTLPQAYGILNARDPGITYYSPIDLVLSELSLRLCLNAACS
jgi:hypothetical protein